MSRFVALCVAFLSGTFLIAAPVPKGARKDATPDLGELFERVGKIVKNGKWPTAVEEKALTDPVKAVFDRMVEASGEKERELPVDFSPLQKADVEGAVKGVSVAKKFIIAGRVQATGFKNCVVFADEIRCTGAKDCILVGKTVRCTSVQNCVIVAEESIQLTGAREGPSVFCAGQWIRCTGMSNAICHVIDPGNAPARRGPGLLPDKALRFTVAENVTCLNAESDCGATRATNCMYLPPKDPIVKLGKR